MRKLILNLATLLALAAPAQAQVTALPTLRPEITVAGDLVRIGDLIENAGSVAETPVFRAPDLGTTGTVQTHRIVEAVRVHGLMAIETKGIAEVVVTRASRRWALKDIENQIAQSIADQYPGTEARNLNVQFDREVRAVEFEPYINAQPRIQRLSYDVRNGRFDIAFDVPGSTAARRHGLRFTGIVIEMVDVPTLSRPLARGEVMRATDIVMERRTRAEIGSDPLAQTDQIAGQAARRAMRPGQPIRAVDLMKPEVVQKGDQVTIIFEAPGITLTTRGKALENGTEGDQIAVLNPQSKRNVQAVVVGPGQVKVVSVRPIAAASTDTVR